MRDAIAAAMSRSKREIPHYYAQVSIDLTRALASLEQFNAARPPPERLLPVALQARAVARAAAERPGFNGHFGPQGFRPAPDVHLGIAIALRGGGLTAPALMHADRKDTPALMRELTDLVARARSGHLRASELSSATLTVTSLGEEGIDVIYPIIHSPQVAIVGFGTLALRPWVVDGRIEPRRICVASLAADHRVSNGRQGAQFLDRIRFWLEKPLEA